MLDSSLPLAHLSFSLIGLGYVIIGILGFVFAFGIAVFVHELGHFAAAKFFGVKVDRFCIGMDKEAMPFLPRAIFEKRFGETTYALSLVPLGGYVKMAGVVHPEIEKYLEGEEKKDVVPDSAIRPDGAPRPASTTLQGQAMQDMDALYKKPFYAKFIIYSAGVFMNIVTAMVVMAILLTMGFFTSAPFKAEAGYLPEGNPYAAMGVALGDRVIEIDGNPIKNANEMFEKIAAVESAELVDGALLRSQFTMTLKREDQSVYTLPVTLDNSKREERLDIGTFYETFTLMPPYIEATNINDVADKAGLKPGDVVIAINGNPIRTFFELRDVVEESLGTALTFTVQREDKPPFETTLIPSGHTSKQGKGMIGIVPGNNEREFLKLPATQAIAESPERVYFLTTSYVKNLGSLIGKAFQGNTTAVRKELGGPVAIGQLAYRQAQRGLPEWLRFLIILNVALAVMNSLPIPVLDGGHVCFAIYERIVGRPVPPQVLLPILNGAVIFILVLFVLITFNDVFKILS